MNIQSFDSSFFIDSFRLAVIAIDGLTKFFFWFFPELKVLLPLVGDDASIMYC